VCLYSRKDNWQNMREVTLLLYECVSDPMDAQFFEDIHHLVSKFPAAGVLILDAFSDAQSYSLANYALSSQRKCQVIAISDTQDGKTQGLYKLVNTVRKFGHPFGWTGEHVEKEKVLKMSLGTSIVRNELLAYLSEWLKASQTDLLPDEKENQP
jgi:hypothetical protein